MPLHPVVEEEEAGIQIAAVGRAREVGGLLEAVGSLLDVFERLLVPAGWWAFDFGEHDEPLAAVDQLAEAGPGRAQRVLVNVGVEPGAGECVGGLFRARAHGGLSCIGVSR